MATEAKTDSVRLPALHRDAAIVAGSLDEKQRTFDIVWAARAEVPRIDWWTGQRYIEVLQVDAKSIRLDRLESGRAPVLDSHSRWSLASVMGVIEKGSTRIEKGQATATVRMSNREDVAGLVADIRDGIIANVSPGYIIHSYREELRDGVNYRVATDWEPIEISFVPVGADPDAGLARSLGPDPQSPQGATYPCTVTRAAPVTQESKMTDEEKRAAAEAEAKEKAAREASEKRAAEEAEARRKAEEDKTRAHAWTGEDIGKVTARAEAFGLDAAAANAIMADPNVRSLEAATDALQTRAVAQRSNSPRQKPHARVTRDEGDTIRAAVESAVLLRANPQAITVATPEGRERIEQARNWRGMSLLEMGRAYIEETQGGRLRGLTRMELASVLLGMDVAGRSAGMMSTSDFPNLLANVIAKRLRDAYGVAQQSWKLFSRQSNSPDFKEKVVGQLSSAPALKLVREGAEYTYGGMTEGAEKYAIATYGRIVALTRQTIINDDLGAFDRIPMLLGRQAAELEASQVWGILTGNPTMGDGTALFHVDHANLASPGTAIDTTNLGKARAAMRKQKGLAAVAADAEPLNLTPRFLIVSPDKEVEAQQALTAVLAAQTSNVNVFANSLTQITEARITGNTWYLIADPALIDTIEYAYLEGEEGLYTEQRIGFSVDGIEVKARLDFGAKAIDWRGMFKNPGA